MPRPRLLALSWPWLIVSAPFPASASGIATKDDPFAIDVNEAYDIQSSPSVQTDIFAEVAINGTAQPKLVRLKYIGDRLAILRSSATAVGIILPKGAEEFVALADIPDLTFRFDEYLGKLDIALRRQGDGPNAIDFAKSTPIVGDGLPLTALLLDYDVTAQTSRGGDSIAALLNPRLTRGGLALESAWQLNSRPGDSIDNAVRLDTSLTVYDRKSGLRGVLGDFVGRAPASSRALRMAGVQITSDYAQRPDLITQPLPSFGGSVAVPSAVDILIGDRRVGAGEIEPGDFSVRNVPIPVGRNRIGVVVRDALGRETIQTVNLYGARTLLARGLSEAALNAGFVRSNYGRRSNDYGIFGITASYRRGLSDKVTAETSMQSAQGFINGGISSSLLIGNLGVATADLRASRYDHGLRTDTGILTSLAFESVGYPFSITLEASKVSKGYRDLASVAGDPRPGSRYLANLNFDLTDLGIVQLTAVRQYRPIPLLTIATGERERSSRLSASYRTTINRGINLYADISHDFDQRNSTAILLGVSVQLGGRSNARAAIVRQSGRYDYTVGASRAAVLPGDWGYRVEAGTGFIDRLSGAVSHRSDWGFAELEAERVGNGNALRGTAQGALVLAEGNLYATNRMSGGFALVETSGIADVAITRENRAAGRTGKSGFLLVPDLPPYIPTRIALDPKTVPITSVIRKDSATMISGERSGVAVRLEIENVTPVILRLLNAKGEFVAAGTTVRGMPSGTVYVTGFDGLLEINALFQDVLLLVEAGANKGCRAKLSPNKDMRSFEQLGDVWCAISSP